MKKLKKNPLCSIPSKYFSSKSVGDLPRFVRFVDSSFVLEPQILASFSEAEKQDPLFLVNVFTGKLPCSRVLPLVWDESNNGRSLKFLHEIVKKPSLLEEVRKSLVL
jgi:hypothetical protein